MENWKQQCALWRTLDKDTAAQIDALPEEEQRLRFSQDLAFGTGGLRGLMGVGTNRMNVYTVRRAARAVAEYVKAAGNGDKGVAVAYDTRNNSRLFALETALTLCAAGVKAYLFDNAAPTPVLSFAVRDMGCGAGVVITASHNPPAYNGFKVYGSEGYQLTPEEASKVAAHMAACGDVSAIPVLAAEEAAGLLQYLGEAEAERFIAAVSAQGCKESSADLRVVYSPLHGAGARFVPPVLAAKGYELHTVQEQMQPDGDFPTTPSPNPEDPRALRLGTALAERVDADIVIATDPDSDRVGAAVKGDAGYVRLTGNQLGALLIDYLVQVRPPRKGDMLIKTVVTGELGADIAKAHGLGVAEVLTGFKYIGEMAYAWERSGEKRFYFGYEESCGYLADTHALDKDGVSACLLACEMAAHWKAQGKTPLMRLQELYCRHGYTLDTLDSFDLEGEAGLAVIRRTMEGLRSGAISFGQQKCVDYTRPDTGLPTADVLKYYFDFGWMAVRPSGTEPKLKVYYCLQGQDAEAHLQELREKMGALLQ